MFVALQKENWRFFSKKTAAFPLRFYYFNTAMHAFLTVFMITYFPISRCYYLACHYGGVKALLCSINLQVTNSVGGAKSCKIFLLWRDCPLASLQVWTWFEILLLAKNQLSLVLLSILCMIFLFQSCVILDITILWQFSVQGRKLTVHVWA